MEDGRIILVGSDHQNTLLAIVSFYLSQNIAGAFLTIDEGDRARLDELAMLLLPCRAERAARFLASKSCMQLFSSLSKGQWARAKKFNFDEVRTDARSCLTHALA